MGDAARSLSSPLLVGSPSSTSLVDSSRSSKIGIGGEGVNEPPPEKSPARPLADGGECGECGACGGRGGLGGGLGGGGERGG